MYNLEYADFEWDDDKAELNKKDHAGVTFEEACEVFQDDNRVELFDAGHSEDEARYAAIGFSRRGRLLFVVVTLRGNKVRIIHSREADKTMERIYDENN